ncbi:hypothetical protein WICPIJ_006950 [Wickerhamomyces pijperi]|uniref:DRBM domain-containing protein n=1 Tax=Wickerhamomyces pijperi TaxID=599730 RepID=A0A9P8TKE2_WICPI|nr:hypothetical protein WICPIJ_006950 [Wickerhamomyces pijperi]
MDVSYRYDSQNQQGQQPFDSMLPSEPNNQEQQYQGYQQQAQGVPDSFDHHHNPTSYAQAADSEQSEAQYNQTQTQLNGQESNGQELVTYNNPPVAAEQRQEQSEHSQSTITPTNAFEKDPTYASWLLARLVQLKSDTTTFRTTFDNIVNLGLDSKELQEILDMPNIPGSIENLATDEYVKLAGEIKSKFGAVNNFINKNGTLPPASEFTNHLSAPGLDSEEREGSAPIKREDGDEHGFIPHHPRRVIYNERQQYPPPLPSILDNSFARKIRIPKYELPEIEAVLMDKLEYLGEQIIEETTDCIAFLKSEDYSDKDLLKLRSIMLNHENLGRWAYLCHFHYDVDLNRRGSNNENKILSEYFKVYTGALFYDGGYSKEKITPWLTRLIEYRLEEVSRTGELNNIADPVRVKPESGISSYYLPNTERASSYSQQHVQVKPGDIAVNASSGELNSKVYPTFSVDYPTLEKTGTDNAPMFTVGCVIHGEILGIGSFSNLKNAKQLAAKDALNNNIEKVRKYIGLNDAKRLKQIVDVPPAMETPLALQIPVMYGAFEPGAM